jgi:hypothetical protein
MKPVGIANEPRFVRDATSVVTGSKAGGHATPVRWHRDATSKMMP